MQWKACTRLRFCSSQITWKNAGPRVGIRNQGWPWCNVTARSRPRHRIKHAANQEHMGNHFHSMTWGIETCSCTKGHLFLKKKNKKISSKNKKSLFPRQNSPRLSQQLLHTVVLNVSSSCLTEIYCMETQGWLHPTPSDTKEELQSMVKALHRASSFPISARSAEPSSPDSVSILRTRAVSGIANASGMSRKSSFLLPRFSK